MTWVNQPPCENPTCGNDSGCGDGDGDNTNYENSKSKMEYVETRGPETDEESMGGAARVEVYRCLRCQATTRFPRYNSASKIFETRKGRCGEYANLFGAYCRAVGLETRYIADFTDHVWTECLVDGRNWVMVDSCEGVVNEPSMYEAGWGKQLSYVLAVSTVEVVDVTPRYTRKFYSDDFQDRRRIVTITELAGESHIRLARQRLLQVLKPKQREEVSKRLAVEESFLSSCRNSTDWEGDAYDRGRISGSYAWKVSRSEAGNDALTTGKQTGSAATKDDKKGHDGACAHQLAVESYCSTMLNDTFSIRVLPHPTESRHAAIRVNQTACAVGSFDAGKSHGLSVVVVDEGEAMVGCVVQSRAFNAQASLVEFIKSVPTGRIVAMHGSIQNEAPTGIDMGSGKCADTLTDQLPGIVVRHIFEGILFVGQARLKAEWALCQSFAEAPNGIEVRSREATVKLAGRQIQQLQLKTYRETRPRTVVGRLEDSIMTLERQLAAPHEEKRRAFVSWKGARNTCAGYTTHPGGPVYLLGHGSFPLEHVPGEEWVTFLWLPPPLVPNEDVGIVDAAKQSETAAEGAVPAFSVPLDPFFASHLGHEILSNDGKAVATDMGLKDARLVAFYFSAHWCGRTYQLLRAFVVQCS
jgi:Transglutaminase-like superfamily